MNGRGCHRAGDSGSGEAQTRAAASKHTIDGKVTKVDAKRGWVDVKTQGSK